MFSITPCGKQCYQRPYDVDGHFSYSKPFYIMYLVKYKRSFKKYPNMKIVISQNYVDIFAPNFASCCLQVLCFMLYLVIIHRNDGNANFKNGFFNWTHIDLFKVLIIFDLEIRRLLLISELASFWSDSESIRDTERAHQRRWASAVRWQSAGLLESLSVSGRMSRLRLQLVKRHQVLPAWTAVDLQRSWTAARLRQLSLPRLRCVTTKLCGISVY